MMTNSFRPIDNSDNGQIWWFAEIGAPNEVMISNYYTGEILSGVKCEIL